MNAPSTFSREELLRIASSQKAIISLILVNFLFAFCFAAAVVLFTERPDSQAGPMIYWIARGIVLVINIVAVVFIYRLAKALQKTAWVYALAAFFPCVGLITLLIINFQATRTLRQHDVRVGLLGARKSDLESLPPTVAPPTLS